MMLDIYIYTAISKLASGLEVYAYFASVKQRTISPPLKSSSLPVRSISYFANETSTFVYYSLSGRGDILYCSSFSEVGSFTLGEVHLL